MPPQSRLLLTLLLAWSGWSGASGKIGGGWDTAPNTQYHIQTDEGPERYFRYQTLSGQYRKEKRLQDGSVVGTYGSVDADGFLRLRDYVADDKGYRIVRTKTVKVGLEDSTSSPSSSTTPAPPISLSDYLREKEAEATKLRLEGGSLSNQLVPTVGTPTGQPLGASSLQPLGVSSLQPLGSSSLQPLGVSTLEPLRTPSVEVVPNGYPAVPSYTTPASPPLANDYIRPTTFRPQFYNLNALDQKAYETGQYDPYDGVAVTQNGFRYYLPRHYHEEENLPGDRRAGSFGYIDPFGIRRVVYYNTAPGTGFVHRKNNRYVGFSATPYDPRF